MSSVWVTDLPQMLYDEQRADACKVKYHRREDVFDQAKWEALVSIASTTSDLPTTGGTVRIADVNDWLANCGLGLWSVFQLHDPLLPDMDGMFEREYGALPPFIKERISTIFHFSPWDDLNPEKRREKVCSIDVTNTPRNRLLFGLGNVVYWGDEVGPIHTLMAAAEAELHEWSCIAAPTAKDKKLQGKRKAKLEQWVGRLSSFRERMLIGCIPEEEEIAGLIQILRDARGKAWCRNVYFPVWLEQAEQNGRSAQVEAVQLQTKSNLARDELAIPRVETITHTIKTQRNQLGSVIKRAINEAGSKNYHDVFPILVSYAERKSPPSPLVGFAPGDGIQYKGRKYEKNGDLDILTKDALRKRLDPNAR